MSATRPRVGVAATLHKGLPVRAFADVKAWSAFLAAAGPSYAGLWLKIAKADSGIASVAKREAIVAALVHGWIDGQIDSFDARHWLVRFTPRRPKSRWSQVNRALAEDLIARGEMTPEGLAHVEAARADGRWDAAYPSARSADVPDDFAAALAKDGKAAAFFASLSGANRYAVLYRLHHAKPGKARERRIADLAEMLARGETFHPQTPKKRPR